MSRVGDACPLCGFDGAHKQGYGYAAGPLTFCGGCERLVGFSPDTEGMDDSAAEAAIAKANKWRIELAKEGGK